MKKGDSFMEFVLGMLIVIIAAVVAAFALSVMVLTIVHLAGVALG